MAHKTMTLTTIGAQNYRTRALRAGDPITLTGRDARLFQRLGWVDPIYRVGEEPSSSTPAKRRTAPRKKASAKK